VSEQTTVSIRFLTHEELKHSRAFFELTLPRPFTWFLYGVIILLISGFLYAWLGELEVVVRAPVVLRPRQNVSEVKSSLTGMVTEKAFIQGQTSKAGDLLWTLDTRTLSAQREGALGQLRRAESLLADTQIVREALGGLQESLPGENTEAGRKIQLFLKEEHRLSLLADQALRDWDLEKGLPLSSRTPTRIKDLETAAQMSRGQLESFRLSQKQAYSDQEKSLTSEVENLTSQLASLDQQLRGAQVRSPLDGWVEEVKKFNVGDVILAGETLVRIVPESARDLKAELMVASNDIAEIKPGMIFRLIFPKLPPSEFGQLEGTLESVPQDAWLQPDAPPVFQLQGSLSQLWMENNQGLRIDLKAGMTAEARIILKKKAIWRFLLEKLDFLQ